MKLGLGTVQFGMPYGIANAGRVVTASEVADILGAAWQVGVRVLDTAPGYGTSESILGDTSERSRRFSVFTKTPSDTRMLPDPARAVLDSLDQSLLRLRSPSCDGLLVHSAPDLLAESGPEIWGALSTARSRGLATRIGVSVYSPEELIAILGRYQVDVVQLPLNLLDQRFLRTGLLKKLKDAGVSVHARSPFLQGLLLMSEDGLPRPFRSNPELHAVRNHASAAGLSPACLALGFVSSIPEVDVVLAGVMSAEQVEELARAARTPVDVEEVARLASGDETLVDPRRWNVRPDS